MNWWDKEHDPDNDLRPVHEYMGWTEPIDYHDNGRPIWDSKWRILCPRCGEYRERNEYHGRQKPDSACKYCRLEHKKLLYRGIAGATKDSKRAYTHVIQHKRDMTRIYKFHILQGDVPKGYNILFKGKPGELLPRRYMDYEVWDESKQDTHTE